MAPLPAEPRRLLLPVISLTCLITGFAFPKNSIGAHQQLPLSIVHADQLFLKHGKVYVLDLQSKTLSRYTLNKDQTEKQHLSAREILWEGPPLQRPTGLAVDDTDTVYVADPDARALFRLKPNAALEAILVGEPFDQPTGVAVGSDRIYVSDAGARKIFSLYADRRELHIEYGRPTAEFPQKILWSRNKLYAFSRETMSLLLLSSKAEAPTELSDEHPSLAWTVHNPDPNQVLQRGEIVRLKVDQHSLNDVIDFAVSEEILYLFDPKDHKISMFPLLGGAPAEIALKDIESEANAFAIGEGRICLPAGNGVTVLPQVVPATLNLEAGTPSVTLVGLYEYLLKRELLPTRQYVIQPGDSIASVVVRDRVLPAGYVEKFERLFCQLNRKVCKRGVIPDPLPLGTSLVFPNLAIEVSASRRSVTLPYSPAQYSDPRFKKHVGGTLGDVAREFVLRNTPTEELQKDLLLLNYWYRGKSILGETKGTFTIPIQSLRAQFALPKSDVLNLQSALYNLVSRNAILTSPVLFAFVADMEIAVAVDSENATATWSPDPDSKCAPIEPKVWSRALELVHYCRPVEATGSDIAIVDKHFDIQHPELKGGMTLYNSSASSLERGPLPNRDQRKFVREWDHGTHVSALIGARGTANEMVGLDPLSRLTGIRVGDFKDAIDQLYGVNLYSLSFGEDPSSRAGGGPDSTATFKQVLDNDSYLNTLFVVSAGNEHAPVPNDSLAARGSRENVIVIGATDTKEPAGLLADSNFDSELVGVLAPGQNIKSALYGGGYDAASGSSQATAIVAGAASLLRSLEPNWQPWQLKQRIVSAADSWADGPYFDKTFSGMLNVKATLFDRTLAVLKFHTGEDKKTICTGRILYAGVTKRIEVIQPATLPIPIHHSNLRRLKRNSDGNTFTIIYSETLSQVGRPPQHSLKRLLNVPGNKIHGIVDLDFNPQLDACKSRTKINLLELDDLLNGFY